MDVHQNVSGFFTAYDYEDITVNNTAGGVGFSASKIVPTGSDADRKMGHARLILAQLENADARYSLRTATVPVATGPGFLLPQGSQLTFTNFQAMKDFRIIRETGVNGILRVFYFR
jgi:hypothetical protein